MDVGLESSKSAPSGTLPPIRPHPIILSKQSASEQSIQIYEPMWGGDS